MRFSLLFPGGKQEFLGLCLRSRHDKYRRQASFQREIRRVLKGKVTWNEWRSELKWDNNQEREKQHGARIPKEGSGEL